MTTPYVHTYSPREEKRRQEQCYYFPLEAHKGPFWHIEYTGFTDIGSLRQINEDGAISDPREGIFVVADGFGGSASYDPSYFLNSFFQSYFELHPQPPALPLPSQDRALTPQQIESTRAALNEALRTSNQHCIELARENLMYKGAGVTMAALAIRPYHAHWAHVGDCRVYRWSNNRLQRLTQDHTLTNELFKYYSSIFKNNSSPSSENEPFWKDSHNSVLKYRNVIVQGVGIKEDLEPDFGYAALQSGDLYILCSDGFFDSIPDAHLALSLAENKPLDQTCRELKQRALELQSRGKTDNITLLMVHVLSTCASEQTLQGFKKDQEDSLF
ncbi:MAG: serine/threonine-protein phosphatase [Myxococcales bacterium]|nr:serine/threonine-protein phosphatase [Myxococcales bacterium]